MTQHIFYHQVILRISILDGYSGGGASPGPISLGFRDRSHGTTFAQLDMRAVIMVFL